MNRRRADALVGLLVAAVLLVGGGITVQAYQQRRATSQMGSMMGTSMEAVHGTNPLWYVLGTLLAAAVVAGLYLAVREDLTAPAAAGAESTASASRSAGPDLATGAASATTDVTEAPASAVEGPTDDEAAGERPRARVLDLLPDDERRVLEPVLSSPGLTQIELRDRSDFSKSKVSQTVTALEKRGLLYREPQGRTYRIYPSNELQE